MSSIINKNTTDYGAGSAPDDVFDRYNPGKGTLRSLALLAFIGGGYMIDQPAYAFHAGVTCAVPDNGLPFLYDNDRDVVVEHEYSSIKGPVVFESFRRSVLSIDGYNAASDDVMGHCRFLIIDAMGEKIHYVADALPTSVTGTYDFLNPQFKFMVQ